MLDVVQGVNAIYQDPVNFGDKYFFQVVGAKVDNIPLFESSLIKLAGAQYFHVGNQLDDHLRQYGNQWLLQMAGCECQFDDKFVYFLLTSDLMV
jgi:hypothetical protein